MGGKPPSVKKGQQAAPQCKAGASSRTPKSANRERNGPALSGFLQELCVNAAKANDGRMPAAMANTQQRIQQRQEYVKRKAAAYALMMLAALVTIPCALLAMILFVLAVAGVIA